MHVFCPPIAGYAGTSRYNDPYNLIKFSLGATAADAMVRIGRVQAPGAVRALTINPVTGIIYGGSDDDPPGGMMFLPGTGSNLPTSVGTWGNNDGEFYVYVNNNMLVPSFCYFKYIYVGIYFTNDDKVQYYDMGSGEAHAIVTEMIGGPSTAAFRDFENARKHNDQRGDPHLPRSRH